MAVGTFGPIFASIALAFGLFFFIFAARYYVFTATIFLLQLFRKGDHNNSPNGSNRTAKYATNSGARNGRLSKFFGFMNNHVNSNRNRNHATNGSGSERFAIDGSSEPFVSIHLPFYNERNVAERIVSACMSLDYGNYEVIVIDDSTDATVGLLERWKEYQASMTYALNGAGGGSAQLVALQGPALKIVHREKRSGFKGGALNEALKHMDPRAEYVVVLDADFVPAPDLIKSFLSYLAVTSAASIFERVIEMDRKFAAGEISVENYLSERESLVAQVVGRKSVREALKAGGDEIFKLDQLYAEDKMGLEEYFARRSAVVKVIEALGLGRMIYEPFEDRVALIHTFDLDQLLAEGKIEIREYIRRRRLLGPKLAAFRRPEEVSVTDVLNLDGLYAAGRIVDQEWYMTERRWLVDRLTVSPADREILKSDFEVDQLYASGKLDEKEYAQRKMLANSTATYNGADRKANNNQPNGRRAFRILWRNGNNRNHGNNSNHNNARSILRWRNNNRNGKNGNGYPNGELAAIQGYQWHHLNKSENWLTEGIRAEYSGNYVIERTCEEIFGGLKMIAGSVYMIRADLLRKYGWSTSITEDWELTCRLYKDGYKVQYTPLIQVPAECPSTIPRLVRQRERWAEGHTYNAKKHFWAIMRSKKISIREKLEFLYFAPYYLQSVFFMIGTFFWLLSEMTHEYLPFWTAQFGWSLLLTNLISLPLMNLAGLYAEESARKDIGGVFSTIVISYILAPFQAYSALKGLLEKEEGQWIRTFKTGRVTEPIIRMKLRRIWRRLRPKSARRPWFRRPKGRKPAEKKKAQKEKRRWLTGFSLLVLLIMTTMNISILLGSVMVPEVRANVPPWWYNSAWGYRKQITIDHTKVPNTDQSNFPVLINLASDTGLRDRARTDGYDILFTSSDMVTKIPYEREKYTSDTGALVAWVKVTTLSHTTDTVLYMYYGNSGASDQQDAANVWDSSFVSVWHLKEDPSGTAPQMKDSKSTNHGTSGGTMTSGDQVAAKMNGGLDFEGTDDNINCGDINAVDGATSLTVSTWIKMADLTKDGMVLSKGTFAANSALLFWRDETTSTGSRTDTLSAQVGTGSAQARYYGSTGLLNDNNWHYVVMTYVGNSATGLRGYVDGAEDTAQSPVSTTSVPSLASTTTVVYMARSSGGSPFFTGQIDEVRISTTARSADWIKTEYNNQNSPGVGGFLVSIGGETNVPENALLLLLVVPLVPILVRRRRNAALGGRGIIGQLRSLMGGMTP